MRRIERKLLRITDELQALAEERALVEAELEYHRHIDDDARRDAVLSGWEADRLEAGAASADVARFQRRLEEIDRRSRHLQEQRSTLASKLM